MLIKSPHDRGKSRDDCSLRLAVCAEAGPSPDEGVVALIYSARTKLMSVYWFWRRTAAKLPQFHRQMLNVPGDLDEQQAPYMQRMISIRPCEVSGRQQQQQQQQHHHHHHQDGVQFYQLLIQNGNLGLWTALCGISVPGPEADNNKNENNMTPPSVPLGKNWSTKRVRRMQRRRLYQSIEQAFVVPDNLGDLAQLVERKAKSDDSNAAAADGQSAAGVRTVLRAKLIDFSLVSNELLRSLQEVSTPTAPCASVLDLVGRIQAEIRRWQASGAQMPLLQL